MASAARRQVTEAEARCDRWVARFSARQSPRHYFGFVATVRANRNSIAPKTRNSRLPPVNPFGLEVLK
jgi:hypothetical protein